MKISMEKIFVVCKHTAQLVSLCFWVSCFCICTHYLFSVTLWVAAKLYVLATFNYHNFVTMHETIGYTAEEFHATFEQTSISGRKLCCPLCLVNSLVCIVTVKMYRNEGLYLPPPLQNPNLIYCVILRYSKNGNKSNIGSGLGHLAISVI